MLRKTIQLFASLRLTIVCLALAIALVLGGTLAEAHLGLYEVQSRYFRSLFVMWMIPGTQIQLPIFPGGWLIGGVLLVNLIAGHATRFQFSTKKAGLCLAHLGLITLLAGQFFTEAFQRESLMRLETGETRSYSEDARRCELAIIDTTSPERDDVYTVPAETLARGKEIRFPALPFLIRPKAFLPNSSPVKPGSAAETAAIKASRGAGQLVAFATARPDEENIPSAWIEIADDKGPVGDWIVSAWLTRRREAERLAEWLEDPSIGVADLQSFEHKGHSYRLELRPTRYYESYTLKLIEFRHDVYEGTSIAKNYSSLVHLEDSGRGESRDVLIRMNNPLRHSGATYYQSSFEPGGQVSILQVVRNPAATAPYISCAMITAGLLIHFLMRLTGFSRSMASRGNEAAGKKKEARA